MNEMSDAVDMLRSETQSGIQAVVSMTTSELNKSDAMFRSRMAQQSESLRESLAEVKQNTNGMLGELAQDVVNNRGALIDLKRDEDRSKVAIERITHEIGSKEESLQQQLHMFKKEALAEVEAIKRSSERRRLQQGSSRSRPREDD